jgi:hypothetical protein
MRKDFRGSGHRLIEVLSQYLPRRTEKNHKRATIASVIAEILTEDLLNLSPCSGDLEELIIT